MGPLPSSAAKLGLAVLSLAVASSSMVYLLSLLYSITIGHPCQTPTVGSSFNLSCRSFIKPRTACLCLPSRAVGLTRGSRAGALVKGCFHLYPFGFFVLLFLLHLAVKGRCTRSSSSMRVQPRPGCGLPSFALATPGAIASEEDWRDEPLQGMLQGNRVQLHVSAKSGARTPLLHRRLVVPCTCLCSIKTIPRTERFDCLVSTIERERDRERERERERQRERERERFLLGLRPTQVGAVGSAAQRLSECYRTTARR